jgi:dephospho-CoA kinase
VIRIGLTGGMGAGKSSVARYLSQHNVPVLDADQVARSVVAPGSPCLERIVQVFGQEVVDQDGNLRRKVLGERVAGDPELRRQLEHITHPAIRAEIVGWLELQQKRGAKAAVVEAALMVETGSFRLYDALVVVSASPQARIARIVHRDALDEGTARRWLAAQIDDTTREAHADWVIRNEGDQAELAAILDRDWPAFIAKLEQRKRPNLIS